MTPSDTLAFLVGPRRAEILRFLWSHGPATVREIHAGLPSAAHLAYSTIASYCVDMVDKGLLDQRYADPGERLHQRTTHLYSAAIAVGARYIAPEVNKAIAEAQARSTLGPTSWQPIVAAHVARAGATRRAAIHRVPDAPVIKAMLY